MVKRSKFLTVMFACLPGAGHMFMGFMKLGVSFMVLFFGLFAIAVFLGGFLSFLSYPILLMVPIVWFYAFFDCINKRFCSDEQFQALEDYYLFSDTAALPRFQNLPFKILQTRVFRTVVGVLLILSGIKMLIQNFLGACGWFYDNPMYPFFSNFISALPEFAISLVIILLGIWLIVGKRREYRRDYTEIKELTNHHEQ